MANTVVYPEEWSVKLQERLDLPTNWKELLDVLYTNKQVVRRPYLSTTPAVSAQTRGTAYTFSDFGQTSESLTISTYEAVPIFIDRADLAQSDYASMMYMADLQGQLVNERLENRFQNQHASWTDFGTSSIGLGGADTDLITVSSTNIGSIVRNVKRRIYAANGVDISVRNGIGFSWRTGDWELLEAFAQANGFNLADIALKEGLLPGYKLFGVDHFLTTSNVANHVFAGVKSTGGLGILKDTFGQIVVTQDPSLQSGVGVIARVDFGFIWPNNYDSLYYDINVAT